MLDDYKVIAHEFEKVRKIEIIPLSDLHLGATNCMYDEIKKVIKYIEETPNCYCTLGGDILDNAVITGRNLGIFDSTMTPMKSIQQAVKLLEPIKDKILGCVSGNHEMRSEKVVDMNPMYLIMSELGLQELYRRNLAIIKITIGSRNNNQGSGKNQTYTILLHHGTGTSESAIKKDHEFINQFEGADICITGHTHNSRVARFNKKFINKQSNIVTDREITIIVTNSFLDDSNYSLASMMTGCNNSVISFDLNSGKTKKVKVHY